MGQLRTALRAYALEGYRPAEALKRLDRLLHTVRGEGMATAAYAVSIRAPARSASPARATRRRSWSRPAARRACSTITAAPPLGTLPFGLVPRDAS